MAFRVGQKVQCISYTHRPEAPGDIPRIGGIYTISNIFVEEDEECTVCEMLELIELDQPGDDIWMPGYWSADFRPIVSTDTDMAILEQIRRDVSNKILRPIFEDEQV